MDKATSHAVFGVDKKDWFRGPATIEDGNVVLDLDTAEHLRDLGADESLALDLAGIRSEEDILEFVSRWGLLWHGPGNGEFSEPVKQWLTAAELMSMMLTLAILAKGSAEDPGALREFFSMNPLLQVKDDPEAISDASLAAVASEFVTAFVSRSAQNVRWSMVDAGLVEDSEFPVGTFINVLSADTVHSMAVLLLTKILAKESLPSICKGCGRPFVPEDGRQKYHSKKCGEQARYRAWYQRNKDAGSGE